MDSKVLRFQLLGALFGSYLLSIHSERFFGVAKGVLIATFLAGLFHVAAAFVFGRSTKNDPAPNYLLKNFRLGTPMFVLLAILVFFFLHDFASMFFGGYVEPRKVIFDFALLIQIPLLLSGFSNIIRGSGGSWFSALLPLSLGFSFWAGVNVLLIRFGVFGELATGLENYGEAFLGGMGGQRINAPLGPIGNYFGVINSIAAVVSSLVAVAAIRNGKWLEAVLALANIPVSLYCIYLVENRSSLLVFCAALAFMWIAKRGFSVIVTVLFPAFWLVAPYFVVWLVDSGLLESIIPSFLYNLSRSPDDLLTFGQRAPIFDYGIELLDSGAVPPLGLGFYRADASPAFEGGQASAEGTKTFHCVFLQYGIQYGLIGGIALLLAFSWLAWKAVSPLSESMRRGVVVLIGVLLLSHTFDMILRQQEALVILFAALLPATMAFSRAPVKHRHAESRKQSFA